MKFLVSLGIPDRHFKDRSEGFRYSGAVLQLIDWDKKIVTKQTDYVSPKPNLGEGLSMMFKGAQLLDRYLYVVTNTELLQYDIDEFCLLSVLTHTSFNDLHAVLVNRTGTYICNTGLEIVQRFDAAQEPVDEWNLAGAPTWHRFDPGVDYRTVATTKPHDAHINHLFELGDELWVNLGSRRRAQSLANADHVIDMDSYFGEDEKVLCHDGLVRDDVVYFTSVNGSILVADSASHKVRERIDFSSCENGDRKIGWTRGIEIVGGKAYVGVTKMRHSKFREYTRWMLTGQQRSMPSSILEVDLTTRKVTDVYEMEGFQGCAIYSIIKVD